MFRRGTIFLAALLLAAVSAVPALAAAPDNDDIGSPIVIESIPYTNLQDTSEATVGPTDVHCAGLSVTVWYEYTATADGWLAADTFGSDYDTTLLVGTPDGEGGVDPIACNDDWDSLQSRIVFEAVEGVTYLFQVGAFGTGEGGNLVFNLDESEAPPSPLEFAINVHPTGTFSRSGTATISGTAECDSDGWYELYVRLEQRVGRFTILGDNYTFGECSPESDTWQLEIRGITGSFGGGSAVARVWAYACGEEAGCAEIYTEQQVRLRNR